MKWWGICYQTGSYPPYPAQDRWITICACLHYHQVSAFIICYATLFQTSDNTTRWISLPQHLVKPLHTSRYISCKMSTPQGFPRGFPTELTPRGKPCCIVRIFEECILSILEVHLCIIYFCSPQCINKLYSVTMFSPRLPCNYKYANYGRQHLGMFPISIKWIRINYSAKQYYVSETYFSDWSITICKGAESCSVAVYANNLVWFICWKASYPY